MKSYFDSALSRGAAIPFGRPKLGQTTKSGFTLIEVMVAVAILAISLTAIIGINIASARATPEIKFYVIATQLARLKMIEFEAEMRKDGFSQFEEAEYEGDFDEEGFPEWKWKIKVNKVELQLPTNIGGADEHAGQNAAMASFSGYASIITDIIKNTAREVKLIVYIEDESGFRDAMSVTTHLVDWSGSAMLGGSSGAAPTQHPTNQGLTNPASKRIPSKTPGGMFNNLPNPNRNNPFIKR